MNRESIIKSSAIATHMISFKKINCVEIEYLSFNSVFPTKQNKRHAAWNFL